MANLCFSSLDLSACQNPSPALRPLGRSPSPPLDSGRDGIRPVPASAGIHAPVGIPTSPGIPQFNEPSYLGTMYLQAVPTEVYWEARNGGQAPPNRARIFPHESACSGKAGSRHVPGGFGIHRRKPASGLESNGRAGIRRRRPGLTFPQGSTRASDSDGKPRSDCGSEGDGEGRTNRKPR